MAVARKRWSVALEDAEGPFEWRNVTGRRGRQLLRNTEHTAAVHGFLAALAAQAPLLGWEVVQLDPPRRASRHFRHDGGMRAVNPDAFGVLAKGDTRWPFFLEWERRAVRPSTMSERLAPYLRYFSSHRPTDDHGTRPAVLVVFDDDIARTPLPARGAGGGAGGGLDGPPVGVPQGGHRRAGADGTRLAHPRRPGDPPGPAAPMNDEGRRPMPKQDTHKQEGPRRRRGRIVVRLDTAAVWKRLALLNRSQNWLAREIGVSPGLRVDAGQLGALALRSHPPPDAQGPGSNRVPRPIQIGGER